MFASHLLEYAQRLSCLSIRELKPLVALLSKKVRSDHLAILTGVDVIVPPYRVLPQIPSMFLC